MGMLLRKDKSSFENTTSKEVKAVEVTPKTAEASEPKSKTKKK